MKRRDFNDSLPADKDVVFRFIFVVKRDYHMSGSDLDDPDLMNNRMDKKRELHERV